MEKLKIVKQCKECKTSLLDIAEVKFLQATIVHRNIHVEIVADTICLHCAQAALRIKWDELANETKAKSQRGER